MSARNAGGTAIPEQYDCQSICSEPGVHSLRPCLVWRRPRAASGCVHDPRGLSARPDQISINCLARPSRANGGCDERHSLHTCIPTQNPPAVTPSAVTSSHPPDTPPRLLLRWPHQQHTTPPPCCCKERSPLRTPAPSPKRWRRRPLVSHNTHARTSALSQRTPRPLLTTLTLSISLTTTRLRIAPPTAEPEHCAPLRERVSVCAAIRSTSIPLTPSADLITC